MTSAPQDGSSGTRTPVLDSHTHAFADKVAAPAIPRLEAGALWFEVKACYDGTIGGLLASMDRAGIRRAIVCSVATKPEQVTKITDWSASVASDRIIPFPSIHPDYPDPEAEAERVAGLGLKGLKFHPQYMGCPLDDPRTVRIARAAARAGLAMMVHAGYDPAFEKDDLAGPERVCRLHEAVPDLRMGAAHLGGWEQWEEALRHVVGRPVYLETSFTLGRCPRKVLDEIFRRHPREYLMFGTDAPWRDQAEDLARLRALGLDADLERRMLWENGHRFAGLEVGEPGG